MSITKLFNVVTVTVATLCLLLLGLGCCTLFLPRMRFSLWCQHYLNAPASLFFYSLGLIGLVFLYVLIKQKQRLLARFGVSENQIINLNSDRLKRLNTLLFIIAFLGPILFTFAFYFAFQGPELLAFFCYLIPGSLGVLASLLLIKLNPKSSPKKFFTRHLLPFILLFCNLYAIGPLYRFCSSFLNFRVYEWIAYVIFHW